jgi:hypothetical protein
VFYKWDFSLAGERFLGTARGYKWVLIDHRLGVEHLSKHVIFVLLRIICANTCCVELYLVYVVHGSVADRKTFRLPDYQLTPSQGKKVAGWKDV